MIESQASLSYARHQNHEMFLSQEDRLPSCYSSPKSIDSWRHLRMHKTIIPILDAYPGSTWMTIGDGAYGSDAYFLKGSKVDVTATSISDYTLSIAKEKGFIDRYRIENAEKLTAPDSSFDFVLCKESYHHFPRPPIAFYEMLRVARKAVILIEPQESSVKIMDYMKKLVKKAIRGDHSTSFEPNGNFIFRMNPKEIAKMMTSLNYEFIAIKKFNDFYHRRLSHAMYSQFSLSTILTKIGIALQDLLCTLRLLEYAGATLIAFKESPSEDLRLKLKQHGFRCLLLPRNPYI